MERIIHTSLNIVKYSIDDWTIYFHRFAKSCPAYGLPFTECEECAITADVMARASVSERLRRTLKRTLAHGDAADLVRFSAARPGGTKIQPQELSYFLHNTTGRRGLTLDDLDDIAGWLRVSIGELFGPTKRAELSGDEQRLVLAFRALGAPQQEHFLAIIEAASVAHRAKGDVVGRRRLDSAASHIKNAASIESDIGAASHGDPGTISAASDLAALRLVITDIAAQLAAAATAENPGRSVSSPDSDEATSGGHASRFP